MHAICNDQTRAIETFISLNIHTFLMLQTSQYPLSSILTMQQIIFFLKGRYVNYSCPFTILPNDRLYFFYVILSLYLLTNKSSSPFSLTFLSLLTTNQLSTKIPIFSFHIRVRTLVCMCLSVPGLLRLTSLLQMTEMYSFLWLSYIQFCIYNTFFVHSPVDEHNSDAINMWVQVSFLCTDFISFG